MIGSAKIQILSLSKISKKAGSAGFIFPTISQRSYLVSSSAISAFSLERSSKLSPIQKQKRL
jgi:hypothetical protein